MTENERRLAMKKVGIIGCGGIARVHAWVLGNMEDVEVKALCDVHLERTKQLAETIRNKAQDVTLTEEWRALCNMDLDVVHVCTPHFLHAPMAEELLRNGKAAFVEKPCAISWEQFEALKKENVLHPGKLGFCFQNRYNETTLFMDQLVKEGRIGRILGGRAFVTWRRDEEYYAESDWKGRLDYEGGGVLINQAIHTLDLLLRYLGEPELVLGSSANHHLNPYLNLKTKGAGGERRREEDLLPCVEVEDTVEAWMEFPEGRRGCFYASNGYAGDAPVIIELQGTKGRICMNGQEVTIYSKEEAPKHFMRDLGQGIGKNYWGCGHKACIEDFYWTLQTGRHYQNDLQGVENTFRTMMKIYEAAR